MTQPKPQSIQPGQILADRYVVVALIGEGGMGVVFEGKHVRLGTRVAIKTLLDAVSDNDEVRQRFDQEARAAAQLKSKHVAQVIDVDETAEGRPFMVMEFLEGYDLEEVIESKRTVEIAEAVDYVLEACSGMVEAHALGIVHRDLKPSNLYCAFREGKACVKVLDFGISKVQLPGETKGLTQTATTFGTPTYMSPEQIQSSKNVDCRADVWSLGVILYELLTGRVPFDGENPGAIIWCICSTNALPPRTLRADIPEGLSDVIMKALAKDRSRRYADVESFAAALEPFGSPGAWDPPDLAPIERTGRLSGRGLTTDSDLRTMIASSRRPQTGGSWTTSRRLAVRRTRTAFVAGAVALVALAAGGITVLLLDGEEQAAVTVPSGDPLPLPAARPIEDDGADRPEPEPVTTADAPAVQPTPSARPTVRPVAKPSAQPSSVPVPSASAPPAPSAKDSKDPVIL